METKAKDRREQEVLSKIIQVLERNLHPERIILFGSRAKREHFKGNPDFDLAIDGERPERETMREIEGQIKAVSGLYCIDIVFLSRVDEAFKSIIENTGKVVYVRRN